MAGVALAVASSNGRRRIALRIFILSEIVDREN
jgi:hypothetical protein